MKKEIIVNGTIFYFLFFNARAGASSRDVQQRRPAKNESFAALSEGKLACDVDKPAEISGDRRIIQDDVERFERRSYRAALVSPDSKGMATAVSNARALRGRSTRQLA